MILYTLLEIVIPIIALSWFAILLFRILSYFKIDKLNLKAEILSQPLISIIIPARNENLLSLIHISEPTRQEAI